MIEDTCDYGIQCSFQLDNIVSIKKRLRVSQHKKIVRESFEKDKNVLLFREFEIERILFKTQS